MNRRPLVLELIAMLMAAVGLMAFGFGIFPVINPIQFDFAFGPNFLTASHVSLLLSVIILWSALRLSRYAQSLTPTETSSARSEPEEASADS